MLASLKNKFTISKFKRDENGSIIVFVMVVFSIMMMVGGAGVDLSRFEYTRSTLQYNLDRAVLAAASLRQEQDPAVVVHDYMSRVMTNEPLRSGRCFRTFRVFPFCDGFGAGDCSDVVLVYGRRGQP